MTKLRATLGRFLFNLREKFGDLFFLPTFTDESVFLSSRQRPQLARHSIAGLCPDDPRCTSHFEATRRTSKSTPRARRRRVSTHRAAERVAEDVKREKKGEEEAGGGSGRRRWEEQEVGGGGGFVRR